MHRFAQDFLTFLTQMVVTYQNFGQRTISSEGWSQSFSPSCPEATAISLYALRSGNAIPKSQFGGCTTNAPCTAHRAASASCPTFMYSS